MARRSARSKKGRLSSKDDDPKCLCGGLASQHVKSLGKCLGHTMNTNCPWACKKFMEYRGDRQIAKRARWLAAGMSHPKRPSPKKEPTKTEANVTVDTSKLVAEATS